MKRCFVTGFITALTMSLLLGIGCSGESVELSHLEPSQVDETQADWVRVDVGLSTSHPYEKNQLENWELEAPEQARGIRIHFSEFETELNQDYFVLGEHVYHGDLGTFTTNVAPGNLVPVQFSTDASNNLYGYDIDYYEYLMPHTALKAHSTHAKITTLRSDRARLTLGLPHPTQPKLNTPLIPPSNRFKDSHYEELIEHDLVYRCWAYISLGTSVPGPLTLTIAPTSLFTLHHIQDVNSSYAKAVDTKSTFNGKSMTMRMDFKNVDMGIHVDAKVMKTRTFKTANGMLKVSTKSIKGGFGAWKLTHFNHPRQHAKTAPRKMKSKTPIIKLNKFDSISKSLKHSTSIQFKSFRIKSIKI
jgi:hypothetical protein